MWTKIETLNDYKGKVRAVRALVTEAAEIHDLVLRHHWPARTPARSLNGATSQCVFTWHLGTAFNQFDPLLESRARFRHTQNALSAVLLLWTLAFNLLRMLVFPAAGSSPQAQGSDRHDPAHR